MTRNPERKEAIVKLRNDGKSLREIGETFGMTRERVRQIIGSGTKANLKCLICGASITDRAGTKYCSAKCRSKAERLRKRPRIERPCGVCGKTFATTAKSRQTYCGKKCKAKTVVSCCITGMLAAKVQEKSAETGKTIYAIIKEAVQKHL